MVGIKKKYAKIEKSALNAKLSNDDFNDAFQKDIKDLTDEQVMFLKFFQKELIQLVQRKKDQPECKTESARRS